jgi:hypothetical protein
MLQSQELDPPEIYPNNATKAKLQKALQRYSVTALQRYNGSTVAHVLVVTL